MKKSYIKKEDRKKILLLTDDIRVHSGVANVGREVVLNTCHRYNWVQMAGAINHPEQGKKFDLSEDSGKKAGVDDASIILYPVSGYGDADTLRKVIELEKPDAIFLITDPRYFGYIFQMENEIRKKIPIIYLNIWDDYPAPMYNHEFYESCDALFGINKQTVNINTLVLGKKANSRVIKYIPHGIDKEMFYPIEEGDSELKEFKNALLGGKSYDFTLLFNSRNIRRKSIPDIILSWKFFLDNLDKGKREKCQLVLHTERVSQHGTDLPVLIDYLFPKGDSQITFSSNKLTTQQMNMLYNISDGVILLSSAEGWGLSLTEGMLTKTPFIANVTGGMQDQMRFEGEDGKWVEFDADFPSNHRGTIKKHGEWALPVYPTNLSIVGSPQTPYIFDDRCSAEDASVAINKLYEMGDEGRKDIGEKGYEWAISDEAGFTATKMGNRIIDGIDELFSTWKPRKSYEFVKDTDIKRKVLNHKLIY